MIINTIAAVGGAVFILVLLAGATAPLWYRGPQ